MMNLDGLRGPFPPDLVTDSYDAAVLREKCEKYGVAIAPYNGDGDGDYTMKMAGGVMVNISGHREEVDCFLYGCEAMTRASRYTP